MPWMNALEESLSQLIIQRDLNPVDDLIVTMQKSKNASLSSKDDQGRSFLLLALEEGVPEIAYKLIELQKDNPEVIFGKDNQDRTPIQLAAAKGFENIVKKIIEIAQNPVHELLTADKKGNMALHQAAAISDVILELLLNSCSQKNIINRVNSLGNTALHEALKNPALESAELLINAGASLEVHNNDQKTPFMLLSNWDLERQIALFCHLDKEKQNYLLERYSAAIIANPQLPHLKKIYFTCSGLLGLKQLVTAHILINPEIRSLSTPLKELEIPPLEHPHRIEDEDADEAVFSDYDRMSLTKVINGTANFLTDLKQRSPISIKNRALTLLFPTLCLFIYGGIEAWLIYKEDTTSFSKDFDSWNSFFQAEVGFGSLGGLGVLLSGWVSSSWWNKEIRISATEWAVLIDSIKKDIQIKLQNLELHNNSMQGDQPIAPELIRDLESDITTLEKMKLPLIGDVSVKSLPLSQVIEIFSHIEETLKTIRNSLNLAKQPLSLFFKTPEQAHAFPKDAHVVDINDNQEGDETTPLLGHHG